MTRQIHGGYYEQEREKVTAGTAHIHRGTDCGHAKHLPYSITLLHCIIHTLPVECCYMQVD